MGHRYLNSESIRRQAQGHWREIFTDLAPGLQDAMAHAPQHVVCPSHGGADGFRLFRDFEHQGGGICNTCVNPQTGKHGFGNGFDLLAWYLGTDLRDAFEKVADHLGGPCSTSRDRSAPPTAASRRNHFQAYLAKRITDTWADSVSIGMNSPVHSKEMYFGKAWSGFSLDRQDAIVDKLLNEPSEAVLVEWMRDNLGIDEIAAERIANARLPEGYGNLSRAAVDRILPELAKDIVVYSEAVRRAGLESHSALSHAEQTGEVMEALPYYGEPLQRHVGFGTGNLSDPPEKRFGRIANPTVHVGLNQLRRVVNCLIRRYGHPSEVVVEVARELKLSRDRKLKIEKSQKERQDLNDKHVGEACNALGLNPENLDRAKRRELSQKMQLWVELNPKDAADRRCPYTGEQISISRLLSSEVEIEHILPFSATLDDSLNNKTIAMRRANRDKGNRAPYEAFGQESIPGYDYEAILQRAALMSREKAKRFAPDAYKQWLRDDRDFLARSLNDTAYLSRISKEYLSLICPPNRVRAIPGRMTAMMRGKFGLNRLLSESTSKNRDDHRHSEGCPKAYKGYVGGSNYCIEIWRNEKGKWDSDVISTFQAYQVIRELGEEEGFKRLRDSQNSQSGKPLIMRLMIGDMVRFNVGGKAKIMRVASVRQSGTVSFSEHHEANVDARNRDKNSVFRYVLKCAGSLQKSHARRVTVSAMGELRDFGCDCSHS